MGNVKLKHILILLTLLILIIVFGCYNSLEPSQGNNPKSIFGNLKIGNVSYYICFEGDNYYDSTNTSYHYTGDTLIVKVIDENANGFLISGEYTKGSTLIVNIKNGVLDSTLYSAYTKSEFYVNIKNDSLIIQSPQDTDTYLSTILFGDIFPFYTYKLPLTQITTNKVVIRGWKTSFPYCECDKEGYIENLNVLNNIYSRANVIVADSPMGFDAPGKTFIYSKECGIIRTYTVSWWTKKGMGWDLLK